MSQLRITKYALLLFLCHGIAHAQSRTLLAEADTAALTKSGTRTLSHWKLWRLDSGEYEVIDASVANTESIQTFRFNSKSLPIGFSIKTAPLNLADPRLPKIPEAEISCEYKPEELTCKGRAGDKPESKQTIPAVSPYVAIGEFYNLDFTWFMTGIVHLASTGKGAGSVDVYAITSGNPPEELALKRDVAIHVIPDGDGSSLVLGRTQAIKKYKLRSDARSLIGTEQGLIVAVTPASHPEFGFVVDNYKEYQPWGVPFGDIAEAAASTPAPATNTNSQKSAKPIPVSSGVMVGRLIRRVQPEYPDAARLNRYRGGLYCMPSSIKRAR